jgi:hypothetical protein
MRHQPARKVVLGLGITLDGYIARPDGTVDFLFMPKDYSMARLFSESPDRPAVPASPGFV